MWKEGAEWVGSERETVSQAGDTVEEDEQQENWDFYSTLAKKCVFQLERLWLWWEAHVIPWPPSFIHLPREAHGLLLHVLSQ